MCWTQRVSLPGGRRGLKVDAADLETGKNPVNLDPASRGVSRFSWGEGCGGESACARPISLWETARRPRAT